MKLVLFTDNLGSGGAQRQLCLLASAFQRFGHEVSVLTYNVPTGEDANFFGPSLDSSGIVQVRLRPVHRWQRPIELAQVLAHLAPDAVLAFQEAASLYAELAGLLGRRWGLVVSERSAVPGGQKGLSRWIRLFHGIADAVISNSEANRRLIIQSWPRLGSKTQVIYNAVDLQHFRPAARLAVAPATRDRRLQLVVMARHEREKNIQNVLEAMLLLRGRVAVCLRWHGGTRADKEPLQKARDFIRVNSLETEVELLPVTRDPRQAYWDSDAVLLASWYEGCPNVVCEAMACGRPVLVSAVSDNPLIVEDGVTGLLFDPGSPGDIAEAIRRFAAMSLERRHMMGVAGRRRAETLFDLGSCSKRYEELLAGASLNRGASAIR